MLERECSNIAEYGSSVERNLHHMSEPEIFVVMHTFALHVKRFNVFKSISNEIVCEFFFLKNHLRSQEKQPKMFTKQIDISMILTLSYINLLIYRISSFI